MAQVKSGDMVKVHYTGKLDDGTIFDSSLGSEPLEFTVGAGEVIPGFDTMVVGMEPGQRKETVIPVDEAYGPRREEMIVQVEKAQLPPDIVPEVGQELYVQQAGGQSVPVTITDVAESTITIDANHPLAGENLTFEIELVAVDAPPSLIITP